MKRIFVNLLIVVVGILWTINVTAQEIGRPIWIVQHASNSYRCFENAMEDGANGVEIDLWTNKANKEKDWSVDHGRSGTEYWYYSEAARKSKNAGIKDPKDWYRSLKEYLEDMVLPNNKISIIWLDMKSYHCADALMRHVHKILEAKGYSKNNVPPFQIIYGFYNTNHLSAVTSERRDDGIVSSYNGSMIAYFAHEQWPNEGINLAYEGTHWSPNWSGRLGDIEKLLTDNNFPIEHHFTTNGLFSGIGATRWYHVVDARKLMIQNRYCARIGWWTCQTQKRGAECIYEDLSGAMKADFILIEGRTDFISSRFGARLVLQKFVKNFFNPNETLYKDYNKGKYRPATRDDKFWILYNDPSRVRYMSDN